MNPENKFSTLRSGVPLPDFRFTGKVDRIYAEKKGTALPSRQFSLFMATFAPTKEYEFRKIILIISIKDRYNREHQLFLSRVVVREKFRVRCHLPCPLL